MAPIKSTLVGVVSDLRFQIERLKSVSSSIVRIGRGPTGRNDRSTKQVDAQCENEGREPTGA